jgi:putative DNA primase/helicase
METSGLRLQCEWLQSLSFSFFPLRPRSKKAYRDFSWEQYQHRFPTASEIDTWAREFPTSNVAIVTGFISQIIVVEYDGPIGKNSLREFHLPETVTAISKQGHHYYFRHPGERVKNGINILPKVDIRGDGGYIVAPGSIHPSGFQYAWLRDPFNYPIAPVPIWLRYLIAVGNREQTDTRSVRPIREMIPYVQRAVSEEFERVRTAERGSRNHILYRASINLWQLVPTGGIEPHEVEAMLLNAARQCGLPAWEARSAIASGKRFAEANPRKGRSAGA